MSAAPELVLGAAATDQFVVSYGKGGGVGVFTADRPLTLRRGDRVVIVSPRGTEAATILCPASGQQAHLLGAAASGRLLRSLSVDDEIQIVRHQRLAEELFEAARATADQVDAAIEVVDTELLLDGRQVIVQFLGDDPELDSFVQAMGRRCGLEVRLENSAAFAGPFEESHSGGCGKPDCGRQAGGSCSTCSTGGGCSSCGSHVDLRQYFGHLREQLEHRQRRSLA
jgi:hypothetical protein